MEGIDLFSILDEMKEKFDVEYEDEIQNYLSNPGNKNINVVKGIKNEEFVTFIIYDCFSDTKFDYEKFFLVYESIEEVWSDYPTDYDFLWNEDEY